MKRILVFAMILTLFFTLTGCKKTKDQLKFYVIPGQEVSAEMGDDVLLNLAKTEGRVAFTGEDIAGWLWEEQRVQLKKLPVVGLAEDGGSAFFQAEAGDCFVLAIGNRVIYAGGFAPSSGSVRSTRDPYIRDGADDTFYLLSERKDGKGEDPRTDSYLYDYLVQQQLLVSAIQTVEK